MAREGEQMAHFRKVKGGWRAEVQRAGQRVSATRPTKAEAQAWAVAEEAALLAGERQQWPSRTVAEAVDRYLREVVSRKAKRSKSAARADRLRFDAWMREFPWLADKVMHEVTAEDLGRWRDARLAAVSEASVLREAQLYRPMWTRAMDEWRWVGSSPWKGLKLPGKGHARTRLPTWREVRLILRSGGYVLKQAPQTPQEEAMWAWLVALHTGLRSGEVLALARSKVDLARRVYRLEQHKTDAVVGARSVPLTPRAARVLVVLDAAAVAAGRDAYFTISDQSRDVLWRKVRDRCMVEGTANSSRDELREYVLEVAQGSTPEVSDFEVVRRSTIGVQNDLLGQWATAGLPEGSEHTLRLSAWDIEGRVQRAQATVSVDNVAPAAPTSLTATATGNDVALTWDANTEPDLAGYLLYRDGELVNGDGDSSAPIAVHLLRTNAYLDPDVPDGEYLYTVQAVDGAGNISALSDPAGVLLDNRAPQAIIASPQTETRVNGETELLATVEDKDVASVQFEYRTEGQAQWELLGDVLTQEPFTVNWEPTGLALGAYEFRAVATDYSGNTDLDPATIRLVYTDTPVRTATAQVDGGSVTIDWIPSEAAALHRYRVYRDSCCLSREVPAGQSTVTFENVYDAMHVFKIESLDAAGEVVDSTLSVTALVHTPALMQPYLNGPLQIHYVPVLSTPHWTGQLADGKRELSAVAVNTLGLSSAPSAPVAVEIDSGHVLPAAVGLTVTVPAQFHALQIDWLPPSSMERVAGYHLYRATQAGGPYQQIAALDAGSGSYLDSGLTAGQPYFYVVRTADALGNESAASNEDSAVPHGVFDDPLLFFPAQPDLPFYTTYSAGPVHGMAMPGASVELRSAGRCGCSRR